ncbi:MAG: peptidoglycan DD-metalloendopeptidase family protein, partial [Patescibacteria group bacterium]
MFHLIRLAVVLGVVVMFCVIAVVLVQAIECTDEGFTQCKQNGDTQLCNDLSTACQQKIDESVGQQKTLSSTIAYLNTRIRLAQTQITQTQIDIAALEKLINELKTRIDGLELSLQRLTEVLISRIQDSYMHRAKLKDPVLLLFTTNELTQFFTQLKYIQLSQEYTQNLIQQAESQKVTFNNEKQLKEQKQAEVEKLKKKLESQKTSLQGQQQQKLEILAATKNNESKFQSLLLQAIFEQKAIEAALVSGVKVGPVKKGDPIALVGNSGYPGCSTGEHLHFEIRKDNTWVDPANYLSSKTITDEEKGGNSTLGS